MTKPTHRFPMVNLSTSLPLKNLLDNHGSLINRRFIGGNKVRALEICLESHTGSEHCILTSSGTAALYICLAALDMEKEITHLISPAFNFPAAVNCAAFLKIQRISFVDINSKTLLMNRPAHNHVQPGSAIVFTELFGSAALASNEFPQRRFSSRTIIDAAHSLRPHANSYWKKARAAITSFHPSKPFPMTGDGGAIFTNDSSFALTCKSIRNHGWPTPNDKYRILPLSTRGYIPGMNFRCDELKAEIMLKCWNKLSRTLFLKRIANLATYQSILQDKGKWTQGNNISGAYMTIKTGDPIHASKVLSNPRFSIETQRHYPFTIPPLRQTSAFPCATEAAAHCLQVPVGPHLTTKQCKAIAHILIEEGIAL